MTYRQKLSPQSIKKNHHIKILYFIFQISNISEFELLLDPFSM
jgi:hypothetical protein